jgi:hypothetical protein
MDLPCSCHPVSRFYRKLQFSRIDNGHLALGSSRVGTNGLDTLDNVFTLEDLSKHNVTSLWVAKEVDMLCVSLPVQNIVISQ